MWSYVPGGLGPAAGEENAEDSPSLDMQSPASPRYMIFGPQSESTRRKKALQRVFERWDLDKSGLLEAAALRDRGAHRPDNSAMIGWCGDRARRNRGVMVGWP